ncbi:hypothetical protein [Kaustia mangrovi]|uniref:hypothetical protein n=1 Tax=Kaustia mangrovi TaxID=2593653 RepID=UPI001FEB69C4|nr:hypothetical protein [Kaustia mangrovi]
MAQIQFNGRSVPLPASRLARLVLGVLLVIGGLLGFLPVVGFWMLPLGLIVLSFDIPRVRRWRRRMVVRLGAWMKHRYPVFWAKYIGNGDTPAGNGKSRAG